MSIKIEVFSVPGCGHCDRVRGDLKAVADQFGGHQVTWRDVNVLDELDYAVQLGVLTPPAMAIDGELVFAKLPNATTLREELSRRLANERA